MDHLNTIRAFIVENFLFGDGERLHEETKLLESGILDSTGVLELVGYLEGTFGISVDDEEITPNNLNSLKKICGYLERKLSIPKPV